MSAHTEPHPLVGEPEPVCVCGRRESMHAPDGGCSGFTQDEAEWQRRMTASEPAPVPPGPDTRPDSPQAASGAQGAADGTVAPSVHRVEWTIERIGGITGRFVCGGDKSSPCHNNPDGPAGECWAKAWFGELTAEELYDGPNEPTPLRDGPIDVWFEADTALWKYAEALDHDGGAT